MSFGVEPLDGRPPGKAFAAAPIHLYLEAQGPCYYNVHRPFHVKLRLTNLLMGCLFSLNLELENVLTDRMGIIREDFHGGDFKVDDAQSF